ncbi:response regulator [Methylicorpusculum oleiharenae]|uniref:response regulator n=1 Tax=Methylicorpusculum oleiharenae TaxID=1338687 RepID=UPI00135C8853|nr:response regulator [Methylicorpusculum oleiharenae]MCD2450961.1 response regulator [Methylicorpusculum oleiharenae]
MSAYNSLNFRILLIEDEPAEANLVKMALKENNIQCNLHHVTDGLEALEYLRNGNPENAGYQLPDIILLDVNMPRMNGQAFLTEIKSDHNLSYIPVIVFSSADSESEITTSYQLGAVSHIIKPTDMAAFIDTFRIIDAYWFKLTRLPVSKPYLDRVSIE